MASAPETGVSGFRVTPFEDGGAPASNCGTAVSSSMQRSSTALYMNNRYGNKWCRLRRLGHGLQHQGGSVLGGRRSHRAQLSGVGELEAPLADGARVCFGRVSDDPHRRLLGPWRCRAGRTTPATSRSLNWDEPDLGRGWALSIT
ncbi:hypothetical protein CH63R_06597 [Colletotrichum higginsianum IMI 349063]|uniref:Uncharacterized protein n=1 Tax=Colletotrichum higginsianum (strain IMI 349063) TaxID=759273 RepID=A0A1B7YFW9_COLHI|nr:hypothetical protein CH63R_06597 [Colletotrichum higginsianum IMI 349063]OBR10905.1 hypothetical protein CH63R_06597 [Colletotrichum higginsianum IMI 349063]